MLSPSMADAILAVRNRVIRRAAPSAQSRTDMRADAAPLECVACLLIRGGTVLAEIRSVTKKVVPGAVALPGGHVERGEEPAAALRRELIEELDIVALEARYVCTLLHRSQEFRKLHYFAVTRWRGRMRAREADALCWLPLAAPRRLDLDVDRLAVREYRRIHDPGATARAPGRRAPARSTRMGSRPIRRARGAR
jgi:8-oxo-dGTP pyrophosphatase MutT (NUDIX family)